MFMGMRLQMVQVCALCNESVEEHATTCPHRKMTDYYDSLPLVRCPHCRNEVHLNRADLYECRKCHTQFTTGKISLDEIKPDSLQLMNLRTDTLFRANELLVPGKGDFPKDALLKHLKIEMRKARRKARRS